MKIYDNDVTFSFFVSEVKFLSSKSNSHSITKWDFLGHQVAICAIRCQQKQGKE